MMYPTVGKDVWSKCVLPPRLPSQPWVLAPVLTVAATAEGQEAVIEAVQAAEEHEAVIGAAQQVVFGVAEVVVVVVVVEEEVDAMVRPPSPFASHAWNVRESSKRSKRYIYIYIYIYIYMYIYI